MTSKHPVDADGGECCFVVVIVQHAQKPFATSISPRTAERSLVNSPGPSSPDNAVEPTRSVNMTVTATVELLDKRRPPLTRTEPDHDATRQLRSQVRLAEVSTKQGLGAPVKPCCASELAAIIGTAAAPRRGAHRLTEADASGKRHGPGWQHRAESSQGVRRRSPHDPPAVVARANSASDAA